MIDSEKIESEKLTASELNLYENFLTELEFSGSADDSQTIRNKMQLFLNKCAFKRGKSVTQSWAYNPETETFFEKKI